MKFRAVELNRLDEETIANIRFWRNQEFVRKNMFQSHLITEEEHKRYIENVKKNPDRGLFVFYLDGEPFGVFQYELNREDNTATNGSYLIDEAYQIMGYGAIMYYMIGWIEYEYLHIDKLYAEVLDSNKEARPMQVRFGSVLEEVLKDYVEIDGVKHNVYRFSNKVNPPEKNSRIGRLVSQMIDNEPFQDMLVI